jgi:hypothetical protein
MMWNNGLPKNWIRLSIMRSEGSRYSRLFQSPEEAPDVLKR